MHSGSLRHHLGLSENRVYSQWNSHLIGIMISKTIGFRGTLFSDTPKCSFSFPGALQQKNVTWFRWIRWVASGALRARVSSNTPSTVRAPLGWSSHQFGNTDAKLAKQMMRLDMFGYLYHLGFFSWCLKSDVLLHPGVRFFHVFPYWNQVPTFSIASTRRFSSLARGGKGASGPVLGWSTGEDGGL